MWQIWLLTSAALMGLSFLFFSLWIAYSRPSVPDDDRSYMDPLPPLLKMIWYPVQVFAYYLVSNLSNTSLDKVDKQLQKTGVNYLMTAEQFIAVRAMSAIIVLFLALLVILALLPENGKLLTVLIAPLMGYFFPLVWLADSRKRREKEVVKALPVYLDFITMSVEAGLNLTGAIQQAMSKGPKGALRNEFGTVLRDLRAGVSRADALKRMSERLNMKDITSFVNAMVQAEKMGASMATTLRLQSIQRRTERFQRAEKQAMEAPVKLIFPLIVFIFPVTFIVLGFPIVMKFLNQ
jgi:tight adherence protein C